MKEELLIYDMSSRNYRTLNKRNYNDDIIVGLVLLDRKALNEITNYFLICGYVLIDKKNGSFYPIDIQEDKIVILEGTFNCMSTSLQLALVKYNMHGIDQGIYSSFFFEWQFMCDFDVFEKHGSFIKLCSNILGIPERYRCFLEEEVNLYEPTTYEELCVYTKNILNISRVDVFAYDYYASKKYLIDSLVKGYHINFTNNELLAHFLQVSKIVDERWE